MGQFARFQQMCHQVTIKKQFLNIINLKVLNSKPQKNFQKPPKEHSNWYSTSITYQIFHNIIIPQNYNFYIFFAKPKLSSLKIFLLICMYNCTVYTYYYKKCFFRKKLIRLLISKLLLNSFDSLYAFRGCTYIMSHF